MKSAVLVAALAALMAGGDRLMSRLDRWMRSGRVGSGKDAKRGRR